MTLPAHPMAIAALLCSLALPAWGQQYYLYEPKTVAPDVSESSKDGVLVKEVPVREGDTLYGISRKFSGRGMYYPQILLFNDIKNPDLIYTGDMLRIPLPHGETGETSLPAAKPRTKSHKSAKVRKQLSAAIPKNVAKRKLPASEQKITESVANPRTEQDRNRSDQPLPAPEPQKADVSVQGRAPADSGQQLFEKGVKAYRQDDCRTALELFDRYLADYPASPVAADASLYKAECYLKLSAQ